MLKPIGMPKNRLNHFLILLLRKSSIIKKNFDMLLSLGLNRDQINRMSPFTFNIFFKNFLEGIFKFII